MSAKAKEPIVITSAKFLEFPDLREISAYKDLLYFLVRRDMKVRFQQTVIGVLWIVLQPLLQLAIFYFIFSQIARISTDNIPYPVFYLSGYVIWQLLNQIVNGSAQSLLGNIYLLTKAYFPRLILPLSVTLTAIVDFVVTFLILIVFLLLHHYTFNIRYLFIPLIVLLTLIFSLGVGLIFGALMVVFRDVKNLIGFIMQLWMFASPVIYPASQVPEHLKPLFYLNPMTGLIDAFRWVLFDGYKLPSLNYFVFSTISAVIILIIGVLVFRSMETRIADIM